MELQDPHEPLRAPTEPADRPRTLQLFASFSDVNMPFIEPLSDANLERVALEQIVPALLSHGFYYVDGLLGDPAGGAVLDQVKEMHRTGKLQDGRLAGSAPGIHRRSIRGDKIAWVSGSERGCEAVGFLLNLMDKLVSVCARRLGSSTIRERSQVRPRPGSDSELLVLTFLELRFWGLGRFSGRVLPTGGFYKLSSRTGRSETFTGHDGSTWNHRRSCCHSCLSVCWCLRPCRDTDSPSQVKQNQNLQTYPIKTPGCVSGIFFIWIF